MMTFEANGKTYKAKVSYSEEDSQRPLNGRHVPVRITNVTIGEVLPNGELDFITTGDAICMPGDNFVKSTGRHIAAKKAVRFAYTTGAVDPNPEFAKAVLNVFPPSR